MGISRGPKIVSNGLVLCLDAANKVSYPGSGTTWTDLSGNNNTGTLTNGPTFNAGNQGSIVFDGVDDYCRVQNFTSINVQGPGTVTYWGKFSNLGSSNPNVPKTALTITNGLGTSALQVGLRDAQGIVWKAGGVTLLSYNTPTLNRITQWTLTFDNSNLQMYIDGILTNSTTSAVAQTATAANFYLATYSADALEAFSGTIYSSAVYNRVLTATEILQNYNATKGRFGR
jgi:hypothetical protein